MRLALFAGVVLLGSRVAAAPEPDEGVFVAAAEVLSPDASPDLAGANIRLEDVPIRAHAGNGVWVGYTRARQIFVAVPDPSQLHFLPPGTVIDIVGIVGVAPAAAFARRRFALPASDARRLAAAPLYIEAWSVTDR